MAEDNLDRMLYFNASRQGDVDVFKMKGRQLWRSIGHMITPQAALLRNEVEILATVALAIKDSEGRTVLHLAAMCGQTDFCIFLVEQLGVSVDLQDGQGYTPLVLATRERQFDTADYLITKNANVRIANSGGHTALHAAIIAGEEGLVRELIQHGADVNARCEASGTPLLLASALSNHRMMKILLDENADPNITHPTRKLVRREGRWTYCDNCPLFESVIKGSLECVRMLVERGVDASVVSHGQTVLHYAAKEKVGAEELFDCLKRLGNIDVPNHEGLLPINVAANNNNVAAFLALRSSHDSNIKNFKMNGDRKEAKKVFKKWKKEGKRRYDNGNFIEAICMFESCLLASHDEEVFELLFSCHKTKSLESAISVAKQWCSSFPRSEKARTTFRAATRERRA